ncbi:MAG: hypothetical protein L0Z70_03670 [Chloroflexi bacterium]|nr:hypothetical protein [Chloroflexota bacterium]
MNAAVLKSLVAQIHRRFPEVAGSQPTVRPQRAAAPGRAAAEGSLTYLLTFQSPARLASASGAKSFSRRVRVVADENGKIIKISTSK